VWQAMGADCRGQVCPRSQYGLSKRMDLNHMQTSSLRLPLNSFQIQSLLMDFED